MSDPGFTGSVAQELYEERLAPLIGVDSDYHAKVLLNAVGLMFQQASDYARDNALGVSGWSLAMDPQDSPAEALPWLGQFVGVPVHTSTPEADARAKILAEDGLKRGSSSAIVSSISGLLTGTKAVWFIERYGGNAGVLKVTTKTSETPDAGAVQAAILEKKAAGLLLIYNTVTGLDFETLRGTHTTFTQVRGLYVDFEDLRGDPDRV